MARLLSILRFLRDNFPVVVIASAFTAACVGILTYRAHEAPPGAVVIRLAHWQLETSVRDGLNELPIYPEQRDCRRPTTEQVLRLFSLAQRHRLTQAGHTVQLFDAPLTDLQRQVLVLLNIPDSAYRALA